MCHIENIFNNPFVGSTKERCEILDQITNKFIERLEKDKFLRFDDVYFYLTVTCQCGFDETMYVIDKITEYVEENGGGCK